MYMYILGLAGPQVFIFGCRNKYLSVCKQDEAKQHSIQTSMHNFSSLVTTMRSQYITFTNETANLKHSSLVSGQLKQTKLEKSNYVSFKSSEDAKSICNYNLPLIRV